MTATTTAAPAAARSRARYTRVAALGLVLAALGPATFFVAGLAAGLPMEDGVFFLITSGVALLGAALVWWLGTVGKILGVIVSLLVGLALFWTVFGLAFPSSVIDFVPGVLVPLGVLLGLGGSIAAIVARRRGNLDELATTGEQRIMRIALAIALLAVVVSGVLTVTSRSSVAVESAAVSSTMSNFAFSEGTYEVAAGEPTTIRVHNSDPVVHDFAVPELGVEAVTVLPGSDGLVELTAPAGSYTVYCTLHSDPSATDASEGDMVATLVAE